MLFYIAGGKKEVSKNVASKTKRKRKRVQELSSDEEVVLCEWTWGSCRTA